ncbi:MAG: energy transducer TonB [Candidatus Marinimicrobia bacterium]|jgi:protein TonB|nr:energy transducer TonB [Candidatus Neomarinimicrobiota bacterium]MBT4958334.1 energy transducer TonB [Candidatus Neomarinimicrobiota bacterium]MBT6862743.1 energy transducer TonB [Candidatus Neomarinimicrobiota bacterium]
MKQTIITLLVLLFSVGCNNGSGDTEASNNEVQRIQSSPKAQFTEYDTPPMPTSSISPIYPEAAKTDQIEGLVIVQAFILTDGTVGETIILKSLRDDLDQSAIDAIQNTTFEPATADGNPVAVWISMPINYRLSE